MAAEERRQISTGDVARRTQEPRRGERLGLGDQQADDVVEPARAVSGGHDHPIEGVEDEGGAVVEGIGVVGA